MGISEQNQDTSTERHFGIQLRDYFDRKCIRYAAAARSCGFSKFRLDRIFNGADPSLEEGLALSRFLEIPIDKLYHLDSFRHMAA